MNQSTVSSRERKLHKALAAEQAENRRLREELQDKTERLERLALWMKAAAPIFRDDDE